MLGRYAKSHILNSTSSWNVHYDNECSVKLLFVAKIANLFEHMQLLSFAELVWNASSYA